MGQSQSVWDMFKTYGTKSKRMGHSQNVMGQSQIVWDRV